MDAAGELAQLLRARSPSSSRRAVEQLRGLARVLVDAARASRSASDARRAAAGRRRAGRAPAAAARRRRPRRSARAGPQLLDAGAQLGPRRSFSSASAAAAAPRRRVGLVASARSWMSAATRSPLALDLGHGAPGAGAGSSTGWPSASTYAWPGTSRRASSEGSPSASASASRRLGLGRRASSRSTSVGDRARAPTARAQPARTGSRRAPSRTGRGRDEARMRSTSRPAPARGPARARAPRITRGPSTAPGARLARSDAGSRGAAPDESNPMPTATITPSARSTMPNTSASRARAADESVGPGPVAVGSGDRASNRSTGRVDEHEGVGSAEDARSPALAGGRSEKASRVWKPSAKYERRKEEPGGEDDGVVPGPQRAAEQREPDRGDQRAEAVRGRRHHANRPVPMNDHSTHRPRPAPSHVSS